LVDFGDLGPANDVAKDITEGDDAHEAALLAASPFLVLAFDDDEPVDSAEFEKLEECTE